MAKDPVRQTQRHLFFLGGFLAVIITVSLITSIAHDREENLKLAAAMGRSFHQAIDTMRKWNLEQQGVYVPVTDSMQPNPHLDDPERDIVTDAGKKLTMVNHSHMVRLLSEHLKDEHGIRMHFTSMDPIRPKNKPDGWEQAAFAEFDRGKKEQSAVVEKDSRPLFRYMAPVRAEESCLRCHEPSSSDAILGGLSVSFSYAPFNLLMQNHRGRAYLVHALFLVSTLCLVAIFGLRLIAGIKALQESQARIKRLEGMLPICAKCKKIRIENSDPLDQQTWVVVEKYIEEHSEAKFTHGLCPHCADDIYAELAGRSSETSINPDQSNQPR